MLLRMAGFQRVAALPESAPRMRERAREYRRMSVEARDPAIAQELELLADRFLDRARELECAPAGERQVG